jgi:anti-sigma factor RsiW
MTNCHEVRDWIHPYVDGELGAPEQLAFEAHLLECASCRAEYDRVRHVVDTVRGSKPLYPTPATVPANARKLLEGHQSEHRKRSRLRVSIMAISFAATIALVAILPSIRSQRFTSFAADTHLRYTRGSMAFDVRSDQPETVSAWLETHLPFHLALPNFPSQPGEAKSYSLVGARVVQFEGQDVAYLAYTMNARPISLLVASSASVIPSGGEVYTSGKLAFHFSSEKGLKLITWRDRGLSYALVSDVQVEGAQSCVVCHGSQTERQRFENLMRLNNPDN